MQVKIFTLPFDGVNEGFPDELVEQFCLNKKVLRIETHFFRQEGKPYWSVAVHYEQMLAAAEKPRELDDTQKLLFQRLREWRKGVSDQEGRPAYLIATNKQLVQVIQLKCQTLESFKVVKGFGKHHVKAYGKQITELIKVFYETGPGKEAAENALGAEDAAGKADDLPF